MDSLNDLDDQPHRAASAAAAFQKGVYHLFVLRRVGGTDCYDRLLRSYQCVFQLNVSLALLDERFSLNSLVGRNGLSGPLGRRCSDPKRPRRDEIDPACVITHSVFEKKKWRGFASDHSLAEPSARALALYSRAVEARHNLLYRPFLLEGPYWEDCTLMELIGRAPGWQEIEEAYVQSAASIWEWRNRDRSSQMPSAFVFALFTPYADRTARRPTETVLLTYARMLSDAAAPLGELRDFRNNVIDQDRHADRSGIGFPDSWKVGEI